VSASADGPERLTLADLSKPSCAALNAEGEPCGMSRLHDSDFCYIHDPRKAKERAESRRKGGLNRLQALDGHTPREAVAIGAVSDVLRLLEEGAADLLAMKPGERRARALSYLSLSILRALEVGGIEDRLAALEERLSLAPTTPKTWAKPPWPKSVAD
jgi:hypothetical protein